MPQQREQKGVDFARGLTGTPGNLVLLSMSLLAVIPVWLSTYPPMCDLPQHAAQVALLKDLQNPAFPYSASFQVNWFTPYLFGDVLIYALTPLVGIVSACKIVISLAVIAMPLATGILLRLAEVDVFWAILVIPGVYGTAYQWGLLNFLIAAPFGLLFLSLFVHYTAKPPTVARAFIVAIGTILLFFFHALVCAFTMLIAACYAIAETKKVKLACAYIGPLLVVLPLAVLWISLTQSHPKAVEATVADERWLRIFALFPHLLASRDILLDELVGLAVLALPFLAGERAKKSLAWWSPCLIFLAVYLIAPENIFGTNIIYQRFTFFAIPLFLMVLEQDTPHKAMAHWFRAATVLLVAGWITYISYHAILFDARTKGFTEMLARMEPGQAVLSMPFDRSDGVNFAPTFLHIAAWYSALKGGIVDPNFAGFHPELVRYAPGAAPKAGVADFEIHPEQFNWSQYHGEQYRYFVLRSKTDRGKGLFASSPCLVMLRYHSDEWWLYETMRNCSARK